MDGSGQREEMDRALTSTFRDSANTLTHFYSSFMTRQKKLFEAGERHSMEKVRRWMYAKLQEGEPVTVKDICEYLQRELRYLPSHEELNMASQTSVGTGQQVLDSNVSPGVSGQAFASQGSSSSRMDVFSPESGLFGSMGDHEVQAHSVHKVGGNSEEPQSMWVDINEPYNPHAIKYQPLS